MTRGFLSVALCTYNGGFFLRQQLDSLRTQTRTPDELVVCDDDSHDDTMDQLTDFRSTAPFPVRIFRNPKNLGPAANFCQAIAMCHGELVALCDQDDVWRPNKLARAEAAIIGSRAPEATLYCTRLEYVDERLMPRGLSPARHRVGFANAVVENVATGCTVVIASEIRRRLLAASPDDMIMHDWWAYLIASAFGTVIFDPEPSVSYRRHDRNVFGWEGAIEKRIARVRGLLARRLAGRHGLDSLNQAVRFVETYPDLGADERRVVDELVSLRKPGTLFRRLGYSLRPQVGRNDPIEQLALRLIVLLRWH
jgi:glycosyltransferase involved in cell wall biosynthesis